MRLESNLLYGNPTRIIAIGINKNLVQGAQPNDKTKRNDNRKDPVSALEDILQFSYGDQLKKETAEKQCKRIAQGSIPRHNHENVCKDKLSILCKLLEFTGVL